MSLPKKKEGYWQVAEPPERLFAMVMTRIAAAQQRRAWLRLITEGLIGAVSALVLVTLIRSSLAVAASTGFSQYISLLFSDTAVVIGSWREYSLSLIDALPTYGIAGILTTLFMLLILIRAMVRDAALLGAPRHI